MYTFKEFLEMNEESKPDILPKSGGGQEGTDELVKSYVRDTPGQKKAHISKKEE